MPIGVPSSNTIWYRSVWFGEEYKTRVLERSRAFCFQCALFSLGSPGA
jgi:hypothetical protein